MPSSISREVNAIEVYWASGVGVVDHPGDVVPGPAADPQRHLEGVQGQLGRHPVMGAPPDDPTGVDILDERGEAHPRPGRHVGEIDDPQLVRPGRGEVALHMVGRSRRGIVSLRGHELLAPDNALHPVGAHQAGHLAARRDDPVACEQVPHLPVAGDPVALGLVRLQRLDPFPHRRIRQRSLRRRALLERVVARRRDLHPVLGEHPADRLDPEPGPVIIDERDHHGKRGSSSRARNSTPPTRSRWPASTPGSPAPGP